MPTPPVVNSVPQAAFLNDPITGWSEAHGEFPYLTYWIKTDYRSDTGRLPVGIGKDDTDVTTPATELVDVSAPQMLKVVSFEVTRQAKYPEVPDPTPQNPENEELLSVTISPFASKVDNNGNLIWRCSGVYVYALRNPISASDGFTVGITAVSAAEDHPDQQLPAIGPGNFRMGLIQEVGQSTLVTDPGFVPPDDPPPPEKPPLMVRKP